MKRENKCSNLRQSQRILYAAYANKMVYRLARRIARNMALTTSFTNADTAAKLPNFSASVLTISASPVTTLGRRWSHTRARALINAHWMASTLLMVKSSPTVAVSVQLVYLKMFYILNFLMCITVKRNDALKGFGLFDWSRMIKPNQF